MPDCPKCPLCAKKEKKGQTYKVAGRNSYKCSSCKNIFAGSMFIPGDFEWREKETWTITTKPIPREEVTD